MDPSLIDLFAKFGFPTAAAVYVFVRYDRRTEDTINGLRNDIKVRDEIIRDAREVIDKQVEAQHAMIVAQSRIIDERSKAGSS